MPERVDSRCALSELRVADHGRVSWILAERALTAGAYSGPSRSRRYSSRSWRAGMLIGTSSEDEVSASATGEWYRRTVDARERGGSF